MSQPVVYVTLQQFCESDLQPRQLLVSEGFEVRQNPWGRRIRREELPEVLREVDAVLAGGESYDAALLARLPRLRCISRCGSGTDAIDLAAAKRHKIAVLTTNEEVVESVAQLTVAMMLALARNLPLHLGDFHRSVWKRRIGCLLSEWTIGLMGFGRIGRMVARYLRTFRPRVLVSDPQLRPADVPEDVELCEASSLLAGSDLISLHASRRPEEGPLLGRAELSAMKKGSYLVNTARGFLVDEQALYEALQSGHLAGAALDVFETEPYTGPLAQLPSVLCTPHVASFTRASRAAMELRAAQNIVDFFTTRSPNAIVPRRAGNGSSAQGTIQVPMGRTHGG